MLRDQVRTTRAQIIRLRNDYKDIMRAIETNLHEYFASARDAENAVPPSMAPATSHTTAQRLDEPFAKVNSVTPNSPAERAGLQQGDLIRNFGHVKLANHEGLSKVAECVQANEGVRGVGYGVLASSSNTDCA